MNNIIPDKYLKNKKEYFPAKKKIYDKKVECSLNKVKYANPNLLEYELLNSLSSGAIALVIDRKTKEKLWRCRIYKEDDMYTHDFSYNKFIDFEDFKSFIYGKYL